MTWVLPVPRRPKRTWGSAESNCASSDGTGTKDARMTSSGAFSARRATRMIRSLSSALTMVPPRKRTAEIDSCYTMSPTVHRDDKISGTPDVGDLLTLIPKTVNPDCRWPLVLPG